ncbi:hypothetical protein BWI93_03080 [Siphonobacter sp. BAB-5385]|uniref:hypothetical protein n=1 Tax=Siphonobacter sp. BAB-5385 TaxID=1864822 RepID=UPI000B9E8CA6|nr:hypothetical protein [Siphonobacter sp. BAB-5385]OZI09580.1 hypothetical protein BWI93_03080 [Siphonobacter sp. BAB-5385]
MAENDKILDIPFNDPDGSDEAHDQSDNQANAALIGARFTQGRVNRAVNFPGEGRAEITQKLIPLDGEYTFTCWVIADEFVDGPNASWILFKFPGEGNYVYVDLHSPMTSWTYVAIIQETDKVSVYLNSRFVGSEEFPPEWGAPTGWCLLNDNPFNGTGHSSYEDLTIYQGINSGEIITPPVANMEVTYSVNGRNFKDFGVWVSESDGVIDNLNMKEPFKVEWDEYHGEVIDLNRPRYDVREISLSCFIEGVGRDEFLDRVKNFLAEFTKPGTQRLMIQVHSSKPLVYEVYCRESVNLQKKWSDDLMVGTFVLKLREPEPVKRVLKFTGTGTATITLTSKWMTSIYWGDGSKTRNVYGTNKTVSHNFTTGGDHYIIVAGMIEEMTGFSSNAPIVWNQL